MLLTVSGILLNGAEKKLQKNGCGIASLSLTIFPQRNFLPEKPTILLGFQHVTVVCTLAFLASHFSLQKIWYKQASDTYPRLNVFKVYRMRFLFLNFFLATASAVEATAPHAMSAWVFGAALASGIWYFFILLVQAIGFTQL